MRVLSCLSTMRLGARPVAKDLSFIVDTGSKASQLGAGKSREVGKSGGL